MKYSFTVYGSLLKMIAVNYKLFSHINNFTSQNQGHCHGYS
jgi:hypothetical protein